MSRFLEIITPLGEGNVFIRTMSGTESLGRLPEYKLVLVARRGNIKPSELLGKNVTIGIEMSKGLGLRYINGFITQFSDVGETTESYFQENGKGRAYLYQATVHPGLWFLTRRTNSCIFQKAKVPEIIKRIVEKYPLFSVDMGQLRNQNYPEWEYCCQYRETDFNFISRLMEQEGIYYYFNYENGKHTMVLCDDSLCHTHKAGYESIRYLNADDAGKVEEEFICDWSMTYQIQSGHYTTKDFNFENPGVILEKSASKLPEHDLNGFELFDYPGEFEEFEEAQHYADVRIQEIHCQYELNKAQGSVLGIQPGYTFNLTHHTNATTNKRYLVTHATYSMKNNSLGSGGGASEFMCEFCAIPAMQGFRPMRITAKPMIPGPQTAFVVGPKDEEIFTDEYGRVKVQFHWDRYSKADDKSSCYIRVAQSLAGKDWGAMQIPRVGHEVIVEFMEGDPDRPIITGSVYNKAAMPPWTLKENKTRAGIKIRSYKGNVDNFNELRFESKKGAEHIYQHAERDHVLHTKNSRHETIGNESHLIVHKNVLEKIEGDHHYTLKGDSNNKVDGTISLQTGRDLQVKIGGKTALESSGEIHIKAGTKVVIEAGARVSLKVGGSFLTLTPGGLFMNGSMVNVNSGGSAGSGSGASPTAPKEPVGAKGSKGGDKSVVPRPAKPTEYSPQANSLKLAQQKGSVSCAECEAKAAAAAAGLQAI